MISDQGTFPISPYSHFPAFINKENGKIGPYVRVFPLLFLERCEFCDMNECRQRQTNAQINRVGGVGKVAGGWKMRGVFWGKKRRWGKTEA